MYLPRAFAETDLDRLDALIAAHPFVTLVTIDPDGAPFASHLPVLYRRDGERILIRGHWARPNPQASHAGAALMIVHGPHHYVSAGWYPDKEAAARVPTWNYAVAHLHGKLRSPVDEPALLDILDGLSRSSEAAVGEDWRFEPEQAAQRRQVAGTIGFHFVPDRIAMKFKLGQNHPDANRVAVADALDALGTAQAAAVSAMMRPSGP